MTRVLLLGLVLAGCKKAPTDGALAATPEPSAPEAPAAVAPPPPPTPRSLYDACHDRVELPQSDGECTTDAECATAGASSEVCTTATAAADLMTTAERRRCFTVLDACSCVAGRCGWTLLDAIPAGEGLPVGPPGMLPPTGPAGMLPPTGGLPPTTGDDG